MSYSHAGDATLAPAVQSALHKLARPWKRLRAVWIWRDKTSLPVSPALWASIEKALSDSEYFLLLASPAAASSQWVCQEVDWWLQHRSPDKLLILLTDGALEWSAAAQRFDPETTTALPSRLRSLYRGDPPVYVDLRWVKSDDQMSLRHPQFREAMLDIAATLHGKSKEDLDGDDVRQQRRTLRVAWTLVAAILCFAIVAAFAAYKWYDQSQVAEQRRQDADDQRSKAVQATADAVRARDAESVQRQQAERERSNAARQAQVALGRQLIVQSELLSSQNPELQEVSVLLAIEGMRRLDAAGIRSVQADHAIRTALERQPRLVQQIRGAGAVNGLLVSRFGRFFAARNRDNTTVLYAVGEARPLTVFPKTVQVTAWAFSSDERRFGASDGREAFVFDLQQRKLTKVIAELGNATAVRFSADVEHVGTVQEASAATGERVFTVWALQNGRQEFRDPVPATWKEASTRLDGKTPRLLRDGLKELLGDLVFRGVVIPDDFGARQRILGPEAKYLIVTGYVDEAGQVYVYDADHRDPIGTYGTGEQLARIYCSPDGRYVALVMQDTVRVALVPPSTNAARSRIEVLQTIQAEGPIDSVTFSRDGKTIITIANRTARVWDVASGRETCRVTDDLPIRTVESHDGRRLLTVAGDAIRISSCEVGTRGAADGRESDGALHPFGQVTARQRGDGIHVVTVATATERALLAPADRGQQDLVWSPDGARLASGRHGTAVSVWNWPSGKPVRLPGRPPTGRPLAFSADSRYLALGEAFTHVDVVDLETGSRAARLDVRFENDVRLGQLGRYLVARDFANMPRVWNVKTGTLVNREAAVTAVVLIGAGGLWARWSAGGVQIVDLDSGSVRARRSISTKPRVMALSSDGKRLAIGMKNGVIVWDTETQQEIMQLTPDYLVEDLAFDPTGEIMATLTPRVLQLWDIEMKTEIARMPLDKDWYDDPAYRPWVRFFPSSRLVSVEYELRRRSWFWQPEDMIDAACQVPFSQSLTLAQWKAYVGELVDHSKTCGGRVASR